SEGGSFFREGFFKQPWFLTTRSTREVEPEAESKSKGGNFFFREGFISPVTA
ncbi:hypothetical protein GW17_00038654, partial [Ensete ventricosum]